MIQPLLFTIPSCSLWHLPNELSTDPSKGIKKSRRHSWLCRLKPWTFFTELQSSMVAIILLFKNLSYGWLCLYKKKKSVQTSIAYDAWFCQHFKLLIALLYFVSYTLIYNLWICTFEMSYFSLPLPWSSLCTVIMGSVDSVLFWSHA